MQKRIVFLLPAVFIVSGCTEEPEIVNDPMPMPGPMDSTPFLMPVVGPQSHSDSGEDLADSTKIVGVEQNGEAVAYTVNFLSGTETHVINDVIGGRAVTVTYCDRTDVGRAFQGDSEKPLQLAVGGFSAGEMLLSINDTMFAHSSDDIPHNECPFQITTLGEWRKNHPETFVVSEKAPIEAQLE